MFSFFGRAVCVLTLLALAFPARCQDMAPPDAPANGDNQTGGAAPDNGNVPDNAPAPAPEQAAPLAPNPQGAVPPPVVVAPTSLTMPLPSKDEASHIVSTLRDGRGDLWAGTEDKGVWRFDSQGRKWINYRVKDGLGDDNAYALTVDLQGRVWAGHLNHGVSVWNGEQWKNYNVLQGPLGERVFALATSPGDGAVWIATNAGLTRYSPKSDSWTHFSEADGLPTHEISALAFDSVGNLYIGTQCDGLLIGKPDEGFKTWRGVKGPEALPTTAFGSGLPSNLVNDVLVADDDTIYVATTCGLARSKDFGDNWTFIRGMDWEDKLKGLYQKPDYKPLTGALPGQLLREDYVTGLAEDPTGLLWISYRRRGYEIRRPLTDRIAFASAPQNPNDDYKYPYASTLLPTGNFKALVGTYSDGLLFAQEVPQFVPTKEEKAANESRRGWRLQALTQNLTPEAPPLPSPAKAPTLAQLNALLASLGNISPLDAKAPVVAPLPDDWTTQGDWLGRYGRYWASLNAMVSPQDYLWGAGWTPIDHAFQIGPKEKGNSLRYWISSSYTDNPRALEMPPVYFDSRLQGNLTTQDKSRREASIDDNGETYPLTKEGPDIYFSVKIPPGLWTLSFYNHNENGHDWLNRMRDYHYSFRPHDGAKAIRDVSDFDTQPELAHARQRDFWGGVYKRFLVRGPQQLTLCIAKNNSLNAILSGTFLDSFDEQPAPYFGTVEDAQKRQDANEKERDELIAQSAQDHAARFAPATDEKDAANRLFLEVERLRELNPPAWAQKSRPIYEALALWDQAALPRTNAEDTPMLWKQESVCFFNLSSYNKGESLQRRQNLTPARDIEKALKWDGKSGASGKGNAAVTAYLKAHAQDKAAS